MPELEIVDYLKLLGIGVSAKFNQSQNIEFILSVCNRQIYLLKIFRPNSFCAKNIHNIVFYSIVVYGVIYCMHEAWGEFVVREHVARIDQMFKKTRKWSPTPILPLLTDY